ncbi:MAG TPA: DUF4136 domain-containing protein [Gemmatimonadales bacterium]|nr:DUF4136 domain-containing protein [Gemmatimonadales bacterium]
MSMWNASARLWPVAAAGCLTLAGCGGQNISSERNELVPIPAGATVQFRGRTTSGIPGSGGAAANDTIHRYIQQAIIAQLTAKGYKVVDTSAMANFTVRYFLAVRTSADSYGQTGGGVGGPAFQGYGLGYGRTADTPTSLIEPPEPVAHASFEVTLVDERVGRTAWRGMLQAEPKGGTPSEKRIHDLVAKVCASLPAVP